MKKFLLSGLITLSLSTFLSVPAFAESVELNGTDYEITTLIDRDLGPGVRYTRIRIPGYPLNVNMLRVDVTNPYNSVEVQQASEKLYSTELLVNGAKRNTYAGHVALAGANANFWCVSNQPPYSDQMIGVTYNGNLKNGKVITETNSKNDKYNGGLKHTGITGISTDGHVYSSNNFSWEGWIHSAATGDLEIFQCNKIVRDEEIGLYNSFYPSTRTFRCCDMDGSSGVNHFVVIPNCATEVYLTLDEGQEWSAGNEMSFTVRDVKTNAGAGTLGDYDLALVGRGSKAQALAKLSTGDKVTVDYSWIDPNGNRITMSNLVGGNAQVMVDGELTTYNDSENYNSQVYSRTGYGCNADGTVLYIIVIDKANDATYGNSAGCSTKIMCQIAKHYGCTSMTNYDAGGSAMMMVGDKIINRTTEGSPRAVANGMIAFSTAPEDNTVARLEFYDYELKSPIYATSTPRVIAYNQYGAVITDDFTDFILSCPEEAGSCDGNTFTAGGKGVVSTLTASYNGVSVTKEISVIQSDLTLRIKPILIDLHREYSLEVTATVDGNIFTYDPANIVWTNSDPSVISISDKGVLKGLKEGTSEITGTIGDFTDGTTVTVEEAGMNRLPIEQGQVNPAEWTFTTGQVKNPVMTPRENESAFNLDFNISSTRGTRLGVNKEITLYSLPDAIEITFNPGTVSVKSVVLELLPASEKWSLTYTHEATFTASSDNTVLIPIDNFADSSDLATYPIKFESLLFNLGGPTGDCHMEVSSIKAVYNNASDGVDSVIADSFDDGNEHFFNLEGIEMNSENLLPGLYIKVAGGKASKIVIK